MIRLNVAFVQGNDAKICTKYYFTQSEEKYDEYKLRIIHIIHIHTYIHNFLTLFVRKLLHELDVKLKNVYT